MIERPSLHNRFFEHILDFVSITFSHLIMPELWNVRLADTPRIRHHTLFTPDSPSQSHVETAVLGKSNGSPAPGQFGKTTGSIVASALRCSIQSKNWQRNFGQLIT